MSNDSFAVLRRGVQNRFAAVELSREGGPSTGRRAAGRRTGFTRWQASRPAAGLWYRIDRPPGAGDGTEGVDLVGIEELSRDRVRQLAARYGVLFRELLENELPALRWAALFRTLRIMELSGELVTGRFFEGIMGPQFALPGIAAELPAKDHPGTADEPTWWVNACDPASPCGMPLPGLKGDLPSRLPSNHVVFRGDTVVLVSRRSGRDLTFRVASDDPRVSDSLVLFRAMVGRDVRALSAVHVETINGVSATGSPYRSALLAGGFVEDYQRLSLRASA